MRHGVAAAASGAAAVSGGMRGAAGAAAASRPLSLLLLNPSGLKNQDALLTDGTPVVRRAFPTASPPSLAPYLLGTPLLPEAGGQPAGLWCPRLLPLRQARRPFWAAAPTHITAPFCPHSLQIPALYLLPYLP